MICQLNGACTFYVYCFDWLKLRPSSSKNGSVRPSHLFNYLPIIASSWNFQESLPWPKVMSMQNVKVRGQRSRSKRSKQILTQIGRFRTVYLHFVFTHGYEMIHIAWSSIEEVPYCFSRSSVKFHGHNGKKIANFDPNWAFPDCNSSLNSPTQGSNWRRRHRQNTHWFLKRRTFALWNL